MGSVNLNGLKRRVWCHLVVRFFFLRFFWTLTNAILGLTLSHMNRNNENRPIGSPHSDLNPPIYTSINTTSPKTARLTLQKRPVYTAGPSFLLKTACLDNY